MKKSLSSLILFFATFFISCRSESIDVTDQSKNILALVGDKTITVNDFIKRCEYVPRPPYCNGDSYIHKKIALNSLIAEKLLSIEFDKKNFTKTKSQSSFLEGQKEQAMRHLMLQTYGYNKVDVDEKKISHLAKLNNRKYDISYIIIDKHYEVLIDKLPSSLGLIEICEKLNISSDITKKTITKNDDMIVEVDKILFQGLQDLNKVYGPLRVDNNTLLLFSINGWNSNPSISANDKRDAWKEAKNQYVLNRAKEHYGRYVGEIMKGKHIKYNVSQFDKFASTLSKIYLVEKDKREAAIENKIWEIEETSPVASFDDVKKMRRDFIFTHGNKDYTVSDLLALVEKHPLVFRNKKTNPNLFKNELKYAIADLIRDMHITKKAYELGLDKHFSVVSSEQKWDDYIKATVVKNKLVALKNDSNSTTGLLTDNIDSLQSGYDGIIQIDTDKFEKIELSKIDMSVTFLNQPYSKLEPDFPILTDDHFLDYGSKVVFND